LNRVIKIFLLLSAFHLFAQSQPVPRWFIEQGQVPCSNFVVQFSRPYYKDSIKPYVRYFASKKYASSKSMTIFGANLNWKTEAGNYAVSGYEKIAFDTNAFFEIYKSNNFKINDWFVTPNNSFFALVTMEDCDIPESLLQKEKFSKKAPKWLENLPEEKGYEYCIGSCDQYYYDYRTWEEAEKHAIKQLAIMKYSKNSALMKTEDNVGDEIQDQTFQATITNYQVISRWADLKNGIYYVLVRIKS
jgi:hypothetical protein